MLQKIGHSVYLHACLFLPCSLFEEAGNAQNLFLKPVTKWTTINNYLQRGECSLIMPPDTSSVHASAMASFIEVQSGNQPTINTAFSSHRQELYHDNSKRLNATWLYYIWVDLRKGAALPSNAFADTAYNNQIRKGILNIVLLHQHQLWSLAYLLTKFAWAPG